MPAAKQATPKQTVTNKPVVPAAPKQAAPRLEAPVVDENPQTPVYGPQLDPAAYAPPRQPVRPASAMSQAISNAIVAEATASHADYFAESPATAAPAAPSPALPREDLQLPVNSLRK